jgi:hypothetical protein
MAGLTAKIENGEMVIRIPVCNPPVMSKSGKSDIVASTNGNMTTELTVNGRPVVIGLNAYIKR